MQLKENVLKLRNVILGQGRPKICIPLVGKTEEEILDQAREALEEPCQLLEWRADWFDGAKEENRTMALLVKLREQMGDTPLIYTFRTAGEGGEKEVSFPEYRKILCMAASSGMVDLMDVEAFFKEEETGNLIAALSGTGVKVLLSNHSFEETPPDKEMLFRMRRMQEMGPDAVKLAVMPRSGEDVLRLMQVTRRFASEEATLPLITMSMGKQGVISRISGSLTGSCMTFGAAKKTSAPGQIPAGQVALVLNILDL